MIFFRCTPHILIPMLFPMRMPSTEENNPKNRQNQGQRHVCYNARHAVAHMATRHGRIRTTAHEEDEQEWTQRSVQWF
jgi:hypothetical protein